MPEKPGVLIQQLTSNQFSRIGIGAMLDTLTKVAPASWKLLNNNVDRYKASLTEVPRLPKNAGVDTLYQLLFEIFPTFPFVISSQLKTQPTHLEIGQQLQICEIGSTVIQYHENMPHIQQFLQHADASVEVAKPVQKGSEEKPYLPRLVYRDLIFIAKGLNWKPSQKRHEMIEHLYCINGVSQVFLRYYYDLISSAETDDLAQHIHQIFFNFFANIRLQELHYWKNYSSKTKVQIEQIVHKDALHRHPILRRPFFEQLSAFHPIIHDGGQRQMTMSMKTLLDKQLADFRGFSLKKMGNFLYTVAKCKDPEYPRYLILQVVKENPKKIVELYQFCQSPDAPAPMPPELEQVLAPIVQQVAPPAKSQTKIVEDEATRRQKKAQQNMQKRANVAAMTSDQLEGHLERYLNKLYEKSAKKGALNKDNVGKYLARLSKDATEMIQRPNITLEEKQVFEESIDDILQQIGGQLDESEMEEFQGEVRTTLEGFEELTIEERVEKIEDLGNVITAASEISSIKLEADKTQKIYTESLSVKLQVDDNPAHVITIREFLEQPITLKEKMQYLQTHTPHPISIQMMQVIERKQKSCSQGSVNPVSIFKGNSLLPKALARQLFPENDFSKLLKKQIIPILPDESLPLLSVREFFTFPFAEKRQGPELGEWFQQHIFYLELARDDGKFSAEDLQSLMENLENFPTLEYKKYFSIVRRKKFEDTAFMAVYCLWQNNGLDKLRIPSA